MGFVVKTDENDAASIATDLRLIKTRDFADCLIAILFPIGEDRVTCKLFRMLVTNNMKENRLYEKAYGKPCYQKVGDTESVTVKFSPPEVGQSF